MKEQMDPAVKDALALYDNIIRLPVRPINPHERKEHKARIYQLRDGIDWRTGDITTSAPDKAND